MTLLALEVASMLLVMWAVAPVGWVVTAGMGVAVTLPRQRIRRRAHRTIDARRSLVAPVTAHLLPAEAHDPRAHRLAYPLYYHSVQALPGPCDLIRCESGDFAR
ncbi:hypothetical protein TPA0908_17610 [Micromonospora sp. AKA38]|nr:hypothetical protein TPA0908_17610 [Micromonospora sp. AKA38]